MVKDSYEEMALFHLMANNPLQHKDMQEFKVGA